VKATRVDIPSLAAGVAIAALGVVLLLDQSGELDLRFGVLAPITFAMLGVIFLATGLSRRD
jgi:hypothetical protein